MADIFISYAREDRSRIEPLAKALAKQEWSVWWDRTISAGKPWRQVIGDALENARSVIVVWSNASIDSRWVQEEAERGLDRNILIPIMIDNVRPPLGFGTIQAADLIDWEPTQASPEFETLISDISEILGPSPAEVKEAEQKRAEEEHTRKQEEERKLREEKQRKAERELNQNEAKRIRKADEEERSVEEEKLQRIAGEEERKRPRDSNEKDQKIEDSIQPDTIKQKRKKEAFFRVSNIFNKPLVYIILCVILGIVFLMGRQWFLSYEKGDAVRFLG